MAVGVGLGTEGLTVGVVAARRTGCAPGSADAGMPKAEAGAQLVRVGRGRHRAGASDAGTVGFGLALDAASLATAALYETLLACQVASAVHCCWHWLAWVWSPSISVLASPRLPFEIVWVSVFWSLTPSWLTLRVDRVSSFDRLIPARLWLVPWKTAT